MEEDTFDMETLPALGNRQSWISTSRPSTTGDHLCPLTAFSPKSSSPKATSGFNLAGVSGLLSPSPSSSNSPSRPLSRARSSTLFLGTGRIELQRVKDETREVVKEQSLKICESLKEENERIRKEYLKKYHDRLRLYEKSRLNQLNEWRVKTASSPFRLDLNEVERMRSQEEKRVLHDKKKINERLKRLKALSGIMDFEVCPKTEVKKIPSSFRRLALEQRSIVTDMEFNQNELKKITKIIDEECDDIERRFPKVALMRAFQGVKTDESSASTSTLGVNEHLQALMGGANSRIGKQRISAEKARELKEADTRVYAGAGRYDEWGNFVLVENLKQKGAVMTAKYAQVSGSKGPILDMDKFEEQLEMNVGNLNECSIATGSIDNISQMTANSSGIGGTMNSTFVSRRRR